MLRTNIPPVNQFVEQRLAWRDMLDRLRVLLPAELAAIEQVAALHAQLEALAEPLVLQTRPFKLPEHRSN